jgi:hypothetical protein
MTKDKSEVGKPEVGRHQLIYAVTETLDLGNGTSDRKKTVFKIDTATGQVWEYVFFCGQVGALAELLPG